MAGEIADQAARIRAAKLEHEARKAKQKEEDSKWYKDTDGGAEFAAQHLQ